MVRKVRSRKQRVRCAEYATTQQERRRHEWERKRGRSGGERGETESDDSPTPVGGREARYIPALAARSTENRRGAIKSDFYDLSYYNGRRRRSVLGGVAYTTCATRGNGTLTPNTDGPMPRNWVADLIN